VEAFVTSLGIVNSHLGFPAGGGDLITINHVALYDLYGTGLFYSMTSSAPTGAHIIARALRDLGVTVIFGIVGIPVIEIAEEAINLGIRFIAFRNEQAAGYAATAYGYLTGRPGVCLVVGGPGVLHAMAGVGRGSCGALRQKRC